MNHPLLTVRAGTSLICLTLYLALAACGEESPTGIISPRDRNISSTGVGPLALPGTTDSDGDGITDTNEETIARQYRPAWAYDLQEAWYPISMDEWAQLGRYVDISSNTFNSLSSLKNAVVFRPEGTIYTSNGMYAGEQFCDDTMDYGWQLPSDCNDAPVYTEVIPIGGNEVWIQYWLLSHVSATDSYGFPFGVGEHYGDWEHICVRASLNNLGNKTAPPLSIHYHHHGHADIVATPYAYRADRRCQTSGLSHALCYGTKHPVVYVQAWAHGSYKDPGGGTFQGGPHYGDYLSDDDMLNNPLRFITPHRASSSIEVTILTVSRGKWGDPSSPRGPKIFTTWCDNDYNPSQASSGTWLLATTCP